MDPADNAEIERLRAENESLKHQIEDAKTAEPLGRSARGVWSTVLVVLAALVITISVPALWMNRVVLDTDTWVDTIAPLANEPAVQDVVSEAASEALIEAIDSRGVIEEYLPEELSLLSGPISQAVDDFVVAQTDAVVRSDEFATVWEELNRVGHATVVAAVTGREGVVSVEAGVVTLDTGLLAENVQGRLVDGGFEVAQNIPVATLSRQIVLFESTIVGQTTMVFDAIDRAAFFLPLLGLLLAAGGIWLGTDRRKSTLRLGIGVVVAGLLPLQAIYLGQFYLTRQLMQLTNSDGEAAQVIYQTVFADLVVAEQTLAFLGVVVWVGAVLAGPSRWALALRTGVAGGMTKATVDLELGGFGSWVTEHASGLKAAGAGVAAIVLLAFPPPRTITQILWTALGATIWWFGVELVRSSGSATES